MNSNSDAYILMVGTNDDRKNPYAANDDWKTRLLLWNDTESVEKFVDAYVDLGNKLKS